jgi:hypothetical protein
MASPAWATDIKYVWLGSRDYSLVCFLDEYSRYIVHHELLWGMDGASVSVAAQAALETLRKDAEGNLLERPEIRSDIHLVWMVRRIGRLPRGAALAYQSSSPTGKPVGVVSSAAPPGLTGGKRSNSRGLRPWLLSAAASAAEAPCSIQLAFTERISRADTARLGLPPRQRIMPSVGRSLRRNQPIA